jgi:structure-specific endonuclease subunit SLX1
MSESESIQTENTIQTIQTNQEQAKEKEKPWFCYMLVSIDEKKQKTYVGATVNPDRRLRQHNGELSGGARATSGRKWRRRFLVQGFDNEKAALRFEWRWKYLTRQAPGDSWMERRMHALSLLLSDFPFASIVEGEESSTS